MKRFWLITLAVIAVVGLCLLVAACGGQQFPQT